MMGAPFCHYQPLIIRIIAAEAKLGHLYLALAHWRSIAGTCAQPTEACGPRAERAKRSEGSKGATPKDERSAGVRRMLPMHQGCPLGVLKEQND